MLDVAASPESNRNKITWHSGSETNLATYFVEKSADGKQFENLTSLPAEGKAWGYITYDNQPLNGLTYYRLKMVDKDGSYSYSKTVQAYQSRNGEVLVQAYPNPADDVLHVQLFGATEGIVQLTDVSGRLVANATMDLNGHASFNVQHLAAGAYFVKWSNGSSSKTLKVIRL